MNKKRSKNINLSAAKETTNKLFTPLTLTTAPQYALSDSDTPYSHQGEICEKLLENTVISPYSNLISELSRLSLWAFIAMSAIAVLVPAVRYILHYKIVKHSSLNTNNGSIDHLRAAIDYLERTKLERRTLLSAAMISMTVIAVSSKITAALTSSALQSAGMEAYTKHCLEKAAQEKIKETKIASALQSTEHTKDVQAAPAK